MSILKKLLVATLGFGTVTMGALVAFPTQVQALFKDIWGKIKRVINAAVELVDAIIDLFSGMAVGTTTTMDVPLNMQELARSGAELGLTVSPDGSRITVETDQDLYMNDEHPEKKLVIPKGTYPLRGEVATFTIACRKR